MHAIGGYQLQVLPVENPLDVNCDDTGAGVLNVHIEFAFLPTFSITGSHIIEHIENSRPFLTPMHGKFSI